MGFISTEPAEKTAPAETPSAKSPPDQIPTSEELLDYLVNHSDHSRDQLKQEAADLRDDLKFLTPVSSYYHLGRKLGIDLAAVFETKQREYSLDIANLQPGMNNLELTASIKRITDINKFERADGTEGQVCNIILTDSTGKTTLPLWDDDTRYRNELEPGDTVRVEGGYTKTATDYCQNRFGCEIEVRIGDGDLLRKQDGDWTILN